MRASLSGGDAGSTTWEEIQEEIEKEEQKEKQEEEEKKEEVEEDKASQDDTLQDETTQTASGAVCRSSRYYHGPAPMAVVLSSLLYGLWGQTEPPNPVEPIGTQRDPVETLWNEV